MRTRSAVCRWSDVGSLGSRARSVCTCQVLRPRRVAQVLALALLDILPSATQTASAPGISFLSRLNGWPARSPADASPTSSRMPAHGSGPMWFAIPSSWWTRTTYSLPVSRRTRVKTPTLAARVEYPGTIAYHESQIILRTNVSVPRKRIIFSTFFRCMSFHTGWVNNDILPHSPHVRCSPYCVQESDRKIFSLGKNPRRCRLYIRSLPWHCAAQLVALCQSLHFTSQQNLQIRVAGP